MRYLLFFLALTISAQAVGDRVRGNVATHQKVLVIRKDASVVVWGPPPMLCWMIRQYQDTQFPKWKQIPAIVRLVEQAEQRARKRHFVEFDTSDAARAKAFDSVKRE